MINFFNYHTDKLDRNELQECLSKFSTKDFYYNQEYDYSIGLHIIKREPSVAYGYAQHIMKCRWIEVEPMILTNEASAILYAAYVIKDRWPELEPKIINVPHYIYYYSTYVIKGRWLEAEHNVTDEDYWWGAYMKEFQL